MKDFYVRAGAYILAETPEDAALAYQRQLESGTVPDEFEVMGFMARDKRGVIAVVGIHDRSVSISSASTYDTETTGQPDQPSEGETDEY